MKIFVEQIIGLMLMKIFVELIIRHSLMNFIVGQVHASIGRDGKRPTTDDKAGYRRTTLWDPRFL